MIKFLGTLKPGEWQFGIGLTTDELAQLQRRECVLPLPLPVGITEVLIFSAPTEEELRATLLRSDLLVD